MAALQWLYATGARAIAFEVPVRTPGWQRMRVDVAAHDDRSIREVSRGPRGGKKVRTVAKRDDLIAIECKACRSDFLKDSRRSDVLLQELHILEQARLEREQEIQEREPHLLVCESLFPEDARWHYELSEDPAYQKICHKLDRVAKRMHRGTKFESLAESSLFHRHYICAATGVADREEVPPGWGLLEVDLEGEIAELPFRLPNVLREAAPKEVSEEGHQVTLRALAKAGTKALLQAVGAKATQEGELVDRETYGKEKAEAEASVSTDS